MLTKGYPASTQFEKAAANLIKYWRSWEVMHQTNCGVGKGEEVIENGYVDALTWQRKDVSIHQTENDQAEDKLDHNSETGSGARAHLN